MYLYQTPWTSSRDLCIERHADHCKVRFQLLSVLLHHDVNLVGSEDQTLKAWKLNNTVWSVVGNYGGDKAHDAPITALACGGDKVVSGCAGGQLKIWDAIQGNLVATVDAHAGGICDTVYWESSDMKVMISCGKDAAIRVWELSTLSTPNVSTRVLFLYSNADSFV